MNKAVMEGFGIDYKKGIERCMNDEELYAQILTMFLADDSFERAGVAYEAKDYDALLKCVHELKGASGNAALTILYEAACALVENLRHGDPKPDDVEILFDSLSLAYGRVKEGISLCLEG